MPGGGGNRDVATGNRIICETNTLCTVSEFPQEKAGAGVRERDASMCREGGNWGNIMWELGRGRSLRRKRDYM